MKRQNWYLSTIDTQAEKLAREYGLGLEIAEFCTAVNLDTNLEETDRTVGEKMKYADRFILHGPFMTSLQRLSVPVLRPLTEDWRQSATRSSKRRQEISSSTRGERSYETTAPCLCHVPVYVLRHPMPLAYQWQPSPGHGYAVFQDRYLPMEACD